MLKKSVPVDHLFSIVQHNGSSLIVQTVSDFFDMNMLFEIKKLNLSDIYVFPAKGEFRYHTYNDKIKKMAKDIGLDPEKYHTHCLRATAGTTIYRHSGGDLEQVRHQLRHTNGAMSEKYVDCWWTTDAVGDTMKKAMENCLPCLPESWIKEKP